MKKIKVAEVGYLFLFGEIIMIHAVLGKKIGQTQKFLEDGTRVPVTVVDVARNTVLQVKTLEKDAYKAVQLGFGARKKGTKAILGHVKKAELKARPLAISEIQMNEAKDEDMPAVGTVIKVEEVFQPGDIVDVMGISKGKGYAGVVKRHHFKGGPRTHGQSDRERAPGSIGQTTTPGRVYRGKRMSGRMGHEKVTVKNLQIVDVDTANGTVLIKGLVSGAVNSIVMIQKVGTNTKFVPMYKEEKPATTEDTVQKNENTESVSVKTAVARKEPEVKEEVQHAA